MSEVRKNSEDCWRETEQARQDPFLVKLVRFAKSAENASACAEEWDYPTYMCRQARLLYPFRDNPEPCWRAFFIKQTAVPVLAPEEQMGMTHTYPCEWEDEMPGGVIKGTHAGTLVVEKNAAKAAVLWDYTLLDEDGEEVCHSKDLSRDSSMREGLRQVNCYLNCGSKLLPRTGLKITFNALASELCFRRVKSPVEVCWERRLEYGDQKYPRITRKTHGEDRGKEQYELLIRPLSEEENLKAQRFFAKNGWGLFMTTSFLKRTSRDDVSEHTPLSILFHVTNCYEFDGRNLADYIGEGKNFEAGRSFWFGSGNSLFDIVNYVVQETEQGRFEGVHKPHERNVEDILLDLYTCKLPRHINCSATIEQMCDLRKMNVNLFRTTPVWHPDDSMLVKA